MLPFANPLQPLIDVLEQVLLFFHDTVGVGWGLSIILLTITVRALLLPLTLRQVKSMQRLQLLAPELRRIQAKYKNDKQRQQQEMMKFYQENRVNPLASCFPLLFQLPFFISLYYMLRSDLRMDICGQTAKACADATLAQFQSVGSTPGSEGFLFIPDLTGRATGAVLVVLIVLYVGSQLVSGLLSTASMDRNQRMIMLALPIVFVTFVINFPAGLMVYWITTNCWTIVQQLIVRKTVGLPNRPKGGLATAGAPASAAALTGGSGSGGGKANGDGATARPKAGRVTSRKRAESTEEADAGNDSARRDAGGPPPSARRKKKRTGRRR
ncbi:YidC/Oxa1 family membrane protein insertase [Conexibacter sp. JD483]|uniref:YidC/Oxa1 family membrane protein insertase n=1 Tax=unclassified Conexibacter TaxID=2627773 RepID=UPI00271B0DE5|nr:MULTISPECIES: YidC/Oxa1 family membrane protein insertase [unclassified Conexibacter]MDO8184442.1 YidC/Oxa1 family membrane protein insertase [Conexibacter sp. CPCC 205706]MDO8197748.1 YidC/Oxa1 family membrane protein insertase [Conexibacter sp. CPCC 205762]MDR9368116.1 YidC/Oxa1 family membrane protein insertase [Conexibacter sp. JD483]